MALGLRNRAVNRAVDAFAGGRTTGSPQSPNKQAGFQIQQRPPPHRSMYTAEYLGGAEGPQEQSAALDFRGVKI